ncbi:hypothetical protein HYH02_009769 [Chlamydomonas schloesseri]|uniref:Pyruvate phosphate dikinase AMP/ATP-binding domain-containing protein n=1 Tax=Chlamydomonas schloesseri TaxID=2026947 RepID=A0A835TN40_9CHLO|nr:hypothetical protein HYH02_009769 [Chlamydomonas schloesseri]|eukprot:KAG2441975.1 hypothetical protein HYH02_009769 [Chlamydomonas schloesseri]
MQHAGHATTKAPALNSRLLLGRAPALMSRLAQGSARQTAAGLGAAALPARRTQRGLAAAGAVRVSASLQAVAAPPRGGAAAGGAKRKGKGPALISEARFDDVGLSATAEQQGDTYTVRLRLDAPRGMTLHWAVDDWLLPPQAAWPAGTVQIDNKAVQTAFRDGGLELNFPADVCPHRLTFVLKQTQDGETWFNNGGSNYAVQLRAPPIDSFVKKVLEAEGSFSHWSLVQRLMLATEVLDAADSAGPAGMALMFTWLRLSSTRVLDWYRNSNFQPKDIAHIQKHAGERIGDKARTSEHPLNRLLARGALAGLPRGGGNGDEIRMGILHIMRGNGIREGHRPGYDEPFLEQWHQKLHTNTSPDDIAICEAYLAFLHTGNGDDYRRVLWDASGGRLTPEIMAAWPKPLNAWPHHLPHLIEPFKHYLWILKTTHSGADLDTAMEMAKGFMDDDLRWTIYDILGHRNEWWVPGKIVEARQRLAQYWKAPGSSRDLLLLDIALENWFRTCLERTDFGALGRDDLVECVGLVLRGALITHDDMDLQQCGALWERVRASSGHPLPGDRWSKEWALAALAAAERLGLSVAAHMDGLYGLVQPHAEAFGAACRLDKAHVANFGEEVVRGQPLFLASLLLQKLEPQLRAAAGGAPWQVVSQPGPGGAVGVVEAVGSLAEVQGKTYERPTLLLAAALTGVEDIPAGVVGVLTRSSTDVLSHLAIRARSQRVLLATCFDEAAYSQWRDLAGSVRAAAVDPAVGAVIPAEAPAAAAAAGGAGAGASAGLPRVALQAPEATSAWAVREEQFRPSLVGAKALNLAKLRKALGLTAGAGAEGGVSIGASGVGVPASVALPYGSFERCLREEPRNAAAAAEVARLTAAAAAAAAAGGGLPREELEELRRLVSEDLVAPAELVKQLAEAAAAAGLVPAAAAAAWVSEAAVDGGLSGGSADAEDEEDGGAAAAMRWPAVWAAVCRVWASKWTDRAWLSRRALGLREEDLFMSVLLQQVLPFNYSFVLHTSNPVTHTPGELLGEVVVGMGETLVGNYPGRAMGFTADLQGSGGAPNLVSLPSKRTALRAPGAATLIARSDANAEDLEQYAAAGLYDSVTLQPLVAVPPDYASEPLLGDPAARRDMMGRLAGLGKTVQAAFGGRDQDVEGGLTSDGRLFVVQARPQVELSGSK